MFIIHLPLFKNLIIHDQRQMMETNSQLTTSDYLIDVAGPNVRKVEKSD